MSVAEAEAALRDVDEDIPIEERVRLALAGSLTRGRVSATPDVRIPDALVAPGEEEFDRSLRPQRAWPSSSARRGSRSSSASSSRRPAGAASRASTCCWPGPPGLGKTSLAGIIATEMSSTLRVMSGPALDRKGDMAAILTALEPQDVLFIDEIHRLNRAIEELLYPAMEDGCIDIVDRPGPRRALAAPRADAVHARRRDNAHRAI